MARRHASAAAYDPPSDRARRRRGARERRFDLELEVKRLKGKLVAPSDIIDRVERLGFRLLDVTADHALDAARLPPHHRDPFDRFLIAQAQAEAATLVSDDEVVAGYDVPIMPARA